MFDIPCELDNEISNTSAFSRITELPELEELPFTDDGRPANNRQRYQSNTWRSSSSYDGYGGRRRAPPRTGGFNSPLRQYGRRDSSEFSERFSRSPYWKNQSSSRKQDRLWDDDDEY